MDRRIAAWQHRADLDQYEHNRSMNIYPFAHILQDRPRRKPVSLVWGFLALAVVLAALILL